MTAIRLVAILGGVFVSAGCGCGDLAAHRQATITQLDATGDPSPGQPFEVDASGLPADWGAVKAEQSKDFCGSPVTKIIVPQGHGILLILTPTTRPISESDRGSSAGQSAVDQSLSPSMSAMSHAAFDGNVGEVKRLAALGKSVNGESSDVFTPLMWAASGGHEILALTLMELGADPNVRNSFGHSALSEAARGCHLDVVKLLVAHGADVNAPDVRRLGGYTPLMYAAAHGCPGMCEYLLSHGANSEATDSSGNTPAQIAASHGDLPLSRWLADQQTRSAK